MATSEDSALDELLVMRSQDGDRDAFGLLVGRWQRRLWAYARRLTGSDQAAWDAVQEAWLGMVRGLRRLDDPAMFRKWAYRIVTHKCRDVIRRKVRRREKSLDARDPAGVAEPPAPAEGPRIDALRAAMRRLAPDRRAILTLRYQEAMSTAEIAAVLGIRQGTVKSRLHHARNELKDVLERIRP